MDYETIRKLLKRRLEIIGDQQMRESDPQEQLSLLKTVSEQIDAWRDRHREQLPFRLRHFLDQYSLDIHIMDHIQGGVYSSKRADLDMWLAEVEENPDNQGFINLLLTPS